MSYDKTGRFYAEAEAPAKLRKEIEEKAKAQEAKRK